MAVISTRDAFKEYCLRNKYSNWYFNLIENAALRGWNKKTSSVYVERHHCIPKSLGGINIVYLTAREHFVAHLLLPKMLEGIDKRKMTFALHRLVNGNNKNYCKSSIFYKMIKETNCKASSDRSLENWSRFTKDERSAMRSGENNGRYGKEVSESTRQKIGDANRGRLVGDKHPLWIVGHSEESKKKMSSSKKGKGIGKRWFNDGIKETFDYLENKPSEFKLGRLKRKA